MLKYRDDTHRPIRFDVEGDLIPLAALSPNISVLKREILDLFNSELLRHSYPRLADGAMDLDERKHQRGHQIRHSDENESSLNAAGFFIEITHCIWPHESPQLPHGIHHSKRSCCCRLTQNHRGHRPYHRLIPKEHSNTKGE